MNNRNQCINILLVEDNMGDIDLTLMAFEESELNCEIEVLEDGKSALAYLMKNEPFTNAVTPDLVLLDINLPKLSGLDILTRVKSNPDTRRIPVVILTTSNSDKDIFAAYNNYVNAYLNKPIDFNDFLQLIKNLNHFWFEAVKLPAS
ncbi:response regulator [Eubacteriaceae bacterium ES3]|nr:response regulator [Eubacteriaceae bacterium ES3]